MNSASDGANITDINGTATFSLNTSAHTAGNHTINITYGSAWNASVIEIREHEPKNETMVVINETDAIQGAAEVGSPVQWKKTIRIKNNANSEERIALNFTVEATAANVSLMSADGKKEIAPKHKTAKGVALSLAKAKDEYEFEDAVDALEEKEYGFTYTTPAPEKSETENRTENAKWKKEVTVFSDYAYKNVFSYTDISEAAIPNIHLFWNVSGAPAYGLAYMLWNITNAPPILVNLTTMPKNYTELNKSITLYAIISDDETVTPATGLNMNSIYFNITTPGGYTYTIDNNSIYAWSASPVPPEADRRKFNHSFANTSLAGIHNLTVYIKDKSNNEINRTIFQFEVIGSTPINVTASTPSAASNVTALHGENLTVPINITNFGRATAYNITVTGVFGSGIAWNRTFNELNESQAIETNITLTVGEGTSPGSYQLMPKAVWRNPDASSAENVSAYNITISVSSNPELTLPPQVTASFSHGEKKTITFSANSTGNNN